MRHKQNLKEEGRVVLYQLRNNNAESRKKNVGLELAIMDAKGKVHKSWQYDQSEAHWAEHGWRTLIDAQKRDVLNDRRKWVPYKGSCLALAPALAETRANYGPKG